MNGVIEVESAEIDEDIYCIRYKKKKPRFDDISSALDYYMGVQIACEELVMRLSSNPIYTFNILKDTLQNGNFGCIRTYRINSNRYLSSYISELRNDTVYINGSQFKIEGLLDI